MAKYVEQGKQESVKGNLLGGMKTQKESFDRLAELVYANFSRFIGKSAGVHA
jgi:hypothetical protein